MTEGVCCVTEAVFVTEAERGRRFRVLPAMLEHAVGRAGGGFFSKKQDKVLPLPHCLDFKVAGGFDVDARARCCCVDRQSTASQSAGEHAEGGGRVRPEGEADAGARAGGAGPPLPAPTPLHDRSLPPHHHHPGPPLPAQSNSFLWLCNQTLASLAAAVPL
eukprot:2705696-Rhodomonas_salina.1